jgi:hypothetical protein
MPVRVLHLPAGSKFDKQARFCFATDGSHAAHLAFVVLINMWVMSSWGWLGSYGQAPNVWAA